MADTPQQSPSATKGGGIGVLILVAFFAIVLNATGVIHIHLPSVGSGSSTAQAVGSHDGTHKVNIPRGTCVPNVPCLAAQKYARRILAAEGESSQYGCLYELWTHESGWNAWSKNPTSPAYGIPQSDGHGYVYAYGNWKAQVVWGLNYIKGKYGTPCSAWIFWNSHYPHWY